MNMNNLYYFNVLARFQHYTKAAEYLYITQPSLSHAISSLEKEYGVKLFEKDGRNVKLSKYGKLLYRYTSDGFSSLEIGNRTLSEFNNKEHGFVDFGFLFILGYQLVPNLIKSFHTIREHEQIAVNLYQSTSADSIQNIINGKLDLALCTYIEDNSEIEFTPLFKQNLVCIVPQHHPLARFDCVSIHQIASYPIIQYTNQIGEIQTIITNLFLKYNLTPHVYLRLQEEMTIAGFISAGVAECSAIVPDLDVLNIYNLKKIKIDDEKAYRKIHLARAKNRPMAVCVQVFYDFIIKELKKL